MDSDASELVVYAFSPSWRSGNCVCYFAMQPGMKEREPSFYKSCTHPVDIELLLAFERIVHLSEQSSVTWIVWSDNTGFAGVSQDRRLARLDCNNERNRLVYSHLYLEVTFQLAVHGAVYLKYSEWDNYIARMKW